MTTDSELHSLAVELGRLLAARAARVATAESCTGGWIAKLITDVPGSSAWFDSGFVTYSNRSKIQQLGVSAELLKRRGAVSEDVVAAMADAARQRAAVDLSVAVSGIAGPGGATSDKPVGTVWFGWSSSAGTRTECRRFIGDRESVRRQTVAVALQGMLRILVGDAR